VAVAFTFGCADRSQRVASRDTVHGVKPPIVNTTEAPGTLSAMQRLVASDSSVQWEPQTVLVGDVDCDGVPDSAFVGRSPSSVHVGLIRTNAPTAALLAFGTHGSAVQDEVGSAKARLTLESLDYDPSEAAGAIEGFQRSKACKGLNLGDGESDSMHIFWNRTSHRLEWWRA
jgi:hypothetical protein